MSIDYFSRDRQIQYFVELFLYFSSVCRYMIANHIKDDELWDQAEAILDFLLELGEDLNFIKIN